MDAPQQPADQAAPSTELTTVLGVTQGPSTASCRYHVAGVGAASDDFRRAAEIIAEDAVRLRGGQSPAVGWWFARRAGGPPHRPKQRQAIEVFVKDSFGLPDTPRSAEHLQGTVAELIWYRMLSERVAPGDGRTLVHIADLSWSVYQQGGDGLVVYEIADGVLIFRLWEVKKHHSTAHLSTTVRRACEQLSTNALRYLAQYTACGSKLTDDLGRLYAHLVPMWLDEDPRAGVGVSIATSVQHAPKRRAFGGVSTAFPKFQGDSQREGLVVAVADFPSFAIMVRDIVWTGL